ncbi:MAG: rod shape-determining protein [Microgenomates group bacterium]
MKHTNRLFQALTNLVGTQAVTVDLGSSFTRVAVGSKIVYNEPTCIALHTDSGAVLAIGQQALRLLGKTSNSVQVSFPVARGVISNSDYATEFLTAVLKNIFTDQSLGRQLFGVSALVGMSPSSSPIQKKFLELVLDQSGFGQKMFISQSEVLYQQLASDNNNTVTILDIGGQKTSCSIFAGGELVSSTTIPIGGVDFTEAIQVHFRNEYKGLIGWHSAEAAKKDLEILTKGSRARTEKKISLRTKDIVSQTSKTVVVSSTAFQEPLFKIATEIAEFIELFLGRLPTELVTSVLETGIYLTGGTSAFPGLQATFAELLHTNMFPSQRPQLDCIEGLQRLQTLKFKG